MINAGIDIGYANIKTRSNHGHSIFPSLVGTPEKSEFKLMGTGNIFAITIEDKQYNVGQAAIEQSRFTSRQEDRTWYNSIEYKVLMHAAYSTIQAQGKLELLVVTGLPVAFYANDKNALKAQFEGEHLVVRDERMPLNVTVSKCVVIPQVMGALLNEALDDQGTITNAKIAKGRIGVIDIGGKTSNFLHAVDMGNIERETTSINLGAWDAVRAMRGPIEEICPDANYADHEISDAILTGAIKYRGNPIDIRNITANVLDPMTTQIIAKAKELWPGGGARLDAILLSGGGAMLLGDRIKAQLEHGNIRIVDDAVNANVNGYYKLALYSGK